MAEFRSLGESDWEDEDLLTHDEAGARLREEIAIEEAALREAGGGASAACVQRSRTRLAAMRSRLEKIDAALAAGVGVIRKIDRQSP